MPHTNTPALRRFFSSMTIDYERWHDGIGYDLPALAEMTEQERQAVESRLLANESLDWRDLEALAALNTPTAREALRRLASGKSGKLQLDAIRHLSELGESVDEAAAVARVLRESHPGSEAITTALEAAEEHGTPAVCAALLDCARTGKEAIHCAALLYYHSGLTDEPFDWDHRPFFLRFGAAADRPAAYKELLARLRTAPRPITP